MALDLRHKQMECVIRMLNLNQPSNPNEECYKALIYDDFCEKIIAPLMQVKDLRKQGVTLPLSINKKREAVRDAAVVYFLQPTESNIQRIIADASRSLYHSYHLNFSYRIPRPLLETLASGTLNSGSTERLAMVHDQYLEFVTLEDNMFSLAQESIYLQLNDPSAGNREVEDIIEKVANGLFCVLATLGVVPVIRCPRGGPAEMVASSLDQKLRDHLLSKINLFTEGGGSFMSSFQRPLLCIFDRNFELSVGIQHDFRYRPLVHDVLGLKLNSLKLPGQKDDKKTFVDSSDPFWSANGSSEFPEVAVEIETQLNKYKKDVEEVNRRTGGGNGSAEFDGTDLIGNTKHLMNAVNSLPELTERKKVIDKHTNIATALLGEIKERSLDAYTKKENEMMVRGSIDKSELLSVLKGKGTQMDKLRFAIMYLISLETINQAEVEAVEAALREAEADTRAFQYVKKIKSLNVSLAASADSASRSNIVDWAEKLYGQSISAVTAGVKNLLSSDQQLAVARTVEALTEGKPNPETDSYLMLDPRASKSGSSGNSYVKGPFKEAIVFMIGGGNYIEYSSLQELSQRQEMVKNIIYGATEILTGTELVEQLAVLGQKMGLR
ncbi:Sec1-like protein [Arabidopsis thaliana x Arabidopsis arenosa]|uniref:Sec1-like protein n=1 Tax=Arabidopsis thaliana x Arabidopsis arenosa TaxID=1240361 RepID=A0A8T1YAY4_9BRAS|nr:Sec1-like protein [Arabidopsis thaliana x Arabidopsis arenosa]